jgi:hypothetical protein
MYRNERFSGSVTRAFVKQMTLLLVQLIVSHF